MITRIMLSLKKAAASQGDLWSLGDSTTAFTGIMFAGVRDRDAAGDEVQLENISVGRK